MKKAVLLLVTVLAFNLSNAQEGKGLYYNGIKIDPTQISSIKASAGLSMYVVGVGNIKTRAVLNGSQSRVAVSKDSLVFIADFGTEIRDDFSAQSNYTISSPNDLLLFKLEEKKKDRRLLIGTMGTFSGSAVGLDNEGSIPFEYKQIGDGKYEIKITQAYQYGEYAFVTSNWMGMMTKVWAFRIKN